MKILIWNPKIDREHEISKALQARGVALLFADSFEDAFQLMEFHGDTVDLAIVDCQNPAGKEDVGLRFILKIKLISMLTAEN